MSAAPLDAVQSTSPANGGGAQGVSAATAAATRKGHGPLVGFEALLAILNTTQDEGAGSTNEPAAVGAQPGTPAKGKAAAVAKTSGDLASGDAEADARDSAQAATAVVDPTLIVLPQVAPATLLSQAVEPSATGGLLGGAVSPSPDEPAKPSALLADAAPKSAAAPAIGSSSQDVALLETSTPDGFEMAAATPGEHSPAVKADPTATPQSQISSGGPQQSSTAPATPLPNPGTAVQTPAIDAAMQAAAATTAAETMGAGQGGEQAKPSAAPSASLGTKDRTSAGKPQRVDGVRDGPVAGSGAAISAQMAEAVQSQAETDLTVAGPATGNSDTSLLDAETESPSGAAPSVAENTLSGQATTTPASVIHTEPAQVRALPQTIASLAAQIVKKLDGRSSHFDVALDPVGLGHVNVRLVIGASGKMSAALAFDSPQAAAELRGRAGELHEALENAGFDLSGGLTFDVAGDPGQGQRSAAQDSQTGSRLRGQAFQSALDTASAEAAGGSLAFTRSPASGVDIRI